MILPFVLCGSERLFSDPFWNRPQAAWTWAVELWLSTRWMVVRETP